jgi:DNA-binding Lrp family transcriptional regulator
MLGIPMDAKDAEIIEILRKNARTKNTNIARSIGLTEGAVRARIANLTKEGIIKKFTVETEAAGVEGIVLTESEAGRTKEILVKLKNISDRIYETSGEFDVAVLERSRAYEGDTCQTEEHLRQDLRDQRGVRRRCFNQSRGHGPSQFHRRPDKRDRWSHQHEDADPARMIILDLQKSACQSIWDLVSFRLPMPVEEILKWEHEQ